MIPVIAIIAFQAAIAEVLFLAYTLYCSCTKPHLFKILDYSAIEPCCESFGLNTTIVEV